MCRHYFARGQPTISLVLFKGRKSDQEPIVFIPTDWYNYSGITG